jgi:hypothetical protein
MRFGLFAQSVFEYSSAKSRTDAVDTLRAAGAALLKGLEGIDSQTWMIIGGVLLVLMFLTRHSRQH